MDDIDRISSLPNEILSHILSFLPTKESASTSILSKRWNPLWRSVPTFHFDLHSYQYHLVQCVYKFLTSRDSEQPLRTFRLRYHSTDPDDSNINAWLKFATTEGRVERIELHSPLSVLPSFVLVCKTLVVLKLSLFELIVTDISVVDLPNLKVLHLNSFVLSKDLLLILHGCPNLEVLKTQLFSVATGQDFKRLPKKIRAFLRRTCFVPLDVLSNVRIPSRLRTCCLEYFGGGFKCDLKFARFILQNATHLQMMRILFSDQSSQETILVMIKELSLFSKSSETCSISFE